MELSTADGEPIPVTLAGGFLPSFELPEQASIYRLEHHDPLGGAGAGSASSSPASHGSAATSGD